MFHLNILVFQTNGKQPYSFPALSRFWSGLCIRTNQYLRDKKKKERRGLRKRGVKIHPFHLPWIRSWHVLNKHIGTVELDKQIQTWLWQIPHSTSKPFAPKIFTISFKKCLLNPCYCELFFYLTYFPWKFIIVGFITAHVYRLYMIKNSD